MNNADAPLAARSRKPCLPRTHVFGTDIRARSENLGSAIVGAMRAIELANPETLYGVLSIFSTSNWTKKSILSDAKIKNLLEHMSRRRLGNRDYPADLMGDAYEILLKKFADESKKKAGEFYTPRSVVRLLVRILDPKPGESVYDPACGSGGMLIEAIRHMHNDALCCGAVFGQEKNVTNAAVARMNLFLHGASDFHVLQGDTLRAPKILQNDRLARFDCVLANPPFSLKKWGAPEWSADPYGRNVWGTPSDNNGDFAWLQHMVASMRPVSGRAAVVLPQGVLFREGAEGAIREKLVRSGLVDAVVTLGENLFYGTQLSPCFLVLRATPIPGRAGRVLFVDGSSILTRQRAQNILSDADVDRLFALYSEGRPREALAAVATLDEVAAKGFNLSPKQYVSYPREARRPHAEVLAEFRQARAAVLAAEERLAALLASPEGGPA